MTSVFNGADDRECRLRSEIRVDGFRGRAIDAALRLIETQGHDGWSLRDLAGELGTGAASLYYHFANKDALLAELAAEGFRRLEEALTRALVGRPASEALRACGGAYLHFSRDHPMLYRVMYDERILGGSPVAHQAERSAFAAFSHELRTARGGSGGGEEGGGDPALALWAIGRGIAAMAMTSSLADELPPKQVARNVIEGLEALLGQPLRVWKDPEAAPVTG